MIFRALETFYSGETKSGYVEGFTYTVRKGNHLLAECVKLWLMEGRVEIVSDSEVPESEVSGSGFVR